MMEMNGLSSTALAAATSVPIVAAAANVAPGLAKENGHSHLHHHHSVETDPLVVSMKLAADPTGGGMVQQVHINQENGVASVGGVGVTTDLVNNVVVNPSPCTVLTVNPAVAQAQRITVATTTTGTDAGGGLLQQQGLGVKEESTGTVGLVNSGVTVPASTTPASTAASVVGGLSVASSNTTSATNGAGYENKLFVGGLSWQTSSEKLREYFGKFGQVLEVQVVVDPMTQRSRGFGFITFADAETVRKIVSVPNHILDGKRIDPKHATPRNKQVPAVNSYKTKKIFVGGVSQDTTLDEIKAYFGQFGKVEDAVMLMDQQTMRHRGFGFVTFESDEVVERICEIHYHTIKDKKVECKKAKPKEAQAVVAGVTGLHHAFGHDAAAAAAAAHHLSLATSAAASALGAQRTNPAAAYAAFYGGHLGIAGAGGHPAHHQATSISNHLAAAGGLSGGLASGLGIIPGASGLTGATMVSAAPGPTYSSIRSGLTRYTPYPVRNYVTGNSAAAQMAAPPPPPPPSAAAAQMQAQPAILTGLSAAPQAATASQFAAYHHAAAAAAHHASLAPNPSASTGNTASALDFAGIPGIPTAAIPTAPSNAPSIHPAATFDWSSVYHV